jgi:hypothetical protein
MSKNQTTEPTAKTVAATTTAATATPAAQATISSHPKIVGAIAGRRLGARPGGQHLEETGTAESPAEGQAAEIKNEVVIVRDQGGRGRGLVAGRDFRAGEKIVLYSKKFIAHDSYEVYTKQQYEYMSCAGVTDNVRGTGRYIGKCPGSGLGCLANDSTDPEFIAQLGNCDTVSQVDEWAASYVQKQIEISVGNLASFEPDGAGKGLWLRAAWNIQKGEGLFYNYGPVYWIERITLFHTDPVNKMACLGWLIGKFTDYPALGVINKLPFVVDIAQNGVAFSPSVSDRSPPSESAIDDNCAAWADLITGARPKLDDAFAIWTALCWSAGLKKGWKPSAHVVITKADGTVLTIKP